MAALGKGVVTRATDDCLVYLSLPANFLDSLSVLRVPRKRTERSSQSPPGGFKKCKFFPSSEYIFAAFLPDPIMTIPYGFSGDSRKVFQRCPTTCPGVSATVLRGSFQRVSVNLLKVGRSCSGNAFHVVLSNLLQGDPAMYSGGHATCVFMKSPHHVSGVPQHV